MIERGSQVPVKRQAALLQLSRSSVYYTPRPGSDRDLGLMRRIDELHLALPYYGARKLAKQLRREGHDLGRRHVGTLMRRMGIEALYRRPRTSMPARNATIYPYLLANVVIERPNQVWASDITYLPMAHGFLYLVAILDVASRKVLSFRLSNTLTADFCVAALDEALAKHGTPEIFNTDQGSQGDFQRSSQHLVNGGVVWDGHQGGLRNGQDGHRCGHQAGRVSTSGRLSKPSGYTLLREPRAKTQHWRSTCLSRLVLAGSARPAGWRLSVWARAPDGICHSMNAKNSRYCTRKDWQFARSLGGWTDRRQQFRGSCVATLRREAVYCAIEPRSHSGRPIGWPHDPRPPSLRRTRDCAPTYKIDSPGMSLIHEVCRSWDRMCRGSGAAMAAVLIGGGASAGARSRSVADC